MRRESLNTKILILTISLFVICSLLYGVFFSYQSQNAIMDEFIKRGTSLVKNLSLNAELEILIENRTALKTLAANLLQEKEVQAVKIMNDNRQLLVDLSKPDKLDDKYKETLSLTVTRERDKNISDRFAISLEERENVIPDENGKQTIGYLEVMFSKKGIFDTINIMRRNMLFLAILATIIGCTLALYFSTSIVKPVRRLAKATTRIAEGDWETKLPIDTLDEVGQLTDSFNKMSDALIMKREELEDTYKELANRE
ncbi:MAG: HAMP domain-containing protein, partial [Deltaproteobacteria bacterium]|nr:HAMP domain-containing protein [Deltaproteobacteria bacterium]